MISSRRSDLTGRGNRHGALPKPAEGSWTEHYPELGTGPVSYEDSISPAYYELEREAIFRHSWLNVGRVEQLPRKGSYFTKELDAAGTSVIIVRGTDGEVRAFHNICRHRGNKLVWNDYPQRGGERHLPPVHLQVPRLALRPRRRPHLRAAGVGVLRPRQGRLRPRARAGRGVGGVHLRATSTPTTPSRCATYLGELGAGIEDYPFGEMTQVYKYRADVGANWKLFIDAFAEFYHAPVLHAKQAVAEESNKLQGFGFEALAYEIDGPARHGVVVGRHVPAQGPRHGQADRAGAAQRAVRPVGRARHRSTSCRPALNPARHQAWGIDSFVFFPNFMVLVWAPNWYLTYHYWPTAYNRHTFEGTLYFVPPKNATERLRQELAAVTFKEYALQDGNTLEATQRSIESRAVTAFPLNDQEILLRHLHKTARDRVADHQVRQGETPVRISAAS